MPSALQLASPSRQAMISRLVDKYLPTVYHAVGKRLKVMPWHEEYDDLVSAGMEALAKSAAHFRPEEGFKFHTYVSHAVWRAVCRESALVARRGFVHVPLRYREGSSYGFPNVPQPTSLDVIDDDVLHDHPMNDSEERLSNAKMTLEQLLPALPPRWRWVLERRYLDSWTLDEVAAHLGVTRERARQIQHRALKKLREVSAERPNPRIG